MDLRRDEAKRIARAPAKLNLYLNVLGRREDGFHELETVMLPIRIYDSLSLVPIPPNERGALGPIRWNVVHSADSPRLRPHQVPIGPTNLVVRALELLRLRSGCELGAEVELAKRIPIAAGLGGGSSDAATALKLANLGWKLNWPVDRLAAVAAEIGSDVPFFLSGGPAVCRGRGELVEGTSSVPPLHFVVVKPPVGLSTSEVYALYDSLPEATRFSGNSRNQISAFYREFVRGRINAWGRIIHNSLQAAARALSPWVERMVGVFDQLDFVAHQLSGSGSAYFGVCRHARHARRLATILRTRQLGLVYATRSCH